jgi:hypothetical protein
MAQDAATPNIERLPPLAGTERMRRHRDRRKRQLRCLTIELREAEIDELIRRGRLDPNHRANQVAIRQAMHGFLDQFLRSGATFVQWPSVTQAQQCNAGATGQLASRGGG